MTRVVLRVPRRALRVALALTAVVATLAVGAAIPGAPLPAVPDIRTGEIFRPPASPAVPAEIHLVEATAYCPCPICCGKWSGGPTASGVMPEAGRTLAADVRVFPFGTRLLIPGRGVWHVQDTGSAIVGDRLDLYLGDHDEALRFGRRLLAVLVINGNS